MARTRAAETKARTVTDERGASVTRVYHPTLDTWHDVPTDDVETWYEQGWTATPSEHNSVDDYPELVDYSNPDEPAAVEEPTA